MRYHNKKITITFDYLMFNDNRYVIIEILDKYHGILLSSLASSNIELDEDLIDGLIHIKSKCARKWFIKNIKRFKHILKSYEDSKLY